MSFKSLLSRFAPALIVKTNGSEASELHLKFYFEHVKSKMINMETEKQLKREKKFSNTVALDKSVYMLKKEQT